MKMMSGNKNEYISYPESISSGVEKSGWCEKKRIDHIEKIKQKFKKIIK